MCSKNNKEFLGFFIGTKMTSGRLFVCMKIEIFFGLKKTVNFLKGADEIFIYEISQEDCSLFYIEMWSFCQKKKKRNMSRGLLKLKKKKKNARRYQKRSKKTNLSMKIKMIPYTLVFILEKIVYHSVTHSDIILIFCAQELYSSVNGNDLSEQILDYLNDSLA
ncbi:hypothetical protein BpHYR1_033104 [Brachionus plicatilis]|uniref:Uncharacterized protein n=1 Tax=Brachionus plicatilis TaxID=10195 RepID=A0A3M7SZG3_BRAPC|nr:hypothetical protein BpHYR1_033104 [Brachionus plicatilis]